jgi:lipopolysaccharide transport system ATP-binding protein
MKPIIKVDNVSKQYRLGNIGTGTIREDVQRWWHRVRGKEDPFLKIGDTNDRSTQGSSDYIWALKDINFEVMPGEVLGIIGKNGAGKSTLLKILSKVTGPTTGRIDFNGRIGSLLEVGTGFHPELTGRENIFLNGAILGMTRGEIRSKLDEIIDFSGCERYIDTPVKRYSSGMTVRLGFAVAAHLDPEILIVDEVLAVGDAEFQKKAIGKMQDISRNEGRTVLFVSHNMTAVNTFCYSCIYLKNGTINSIGKTEEIVNKYLSLENTVVTTREWGKGYGDSQAILRKARIVNEDRKDIIIVYINKKIGIEIEYEVFGEESEKIPNIHVFDDKGGRIFVNASKNEGVITKKGIYKSVVWIPENLLNDGTYIVGVALSTMAPVQVHFFVEEALVFDVVENIASRDTLFNQKIPGVIRPKLEWSIDKI